MKTARAMFAAIALLTCGTAAVAGTTGTIEGRVVGNDGAAVAGAVVELRSEETGVQRAKTDARGYFHFLSLYPTKYWLLISRTGYFMYWTRDFEVHADGTTSCNARLSKAFTGIYVTPRHGNAVVTCSY